PNYGLVEHCPARRIRRHLPDSRLQLEADPEESLQQRIMQVRRDAFALALTFVEPHTEFPMELLLIDALKRLLDDFGHPVLARKNKSAIHYSPSSIDAAVAHCLSLPILESPYAPGSVWPGSLHPRGRHAAVQYSFDGSHVHDLRGNKTFTRHTPEERTDECRRYFVCYMACRTVSCEIALMVRRASKLSVVT